MLELYDSLVQFDWYLFPIEVQKVLPICFLSVQEPVEIKCFGSIACTRETFKKVKSFEYYIIGII